MNASLKRRFVVLFCHSELGSGSHGMLKPSPLHRGGGRMTEKGSTSVKQLLHKQSLLADKPQEAGCSLLKATH